MENNIPNCPHCGLKLVQVKDKNYYGCPLWKKNNAGCEGVIFYPEVTRKNNWPVVAFSYKVPSKSMPGVMRQVKVYESGDVECSCWAGGVAKWCRHKRIMMEDIEKLIAQIKKENIHVPESGINYQSRDKWFYAVPELFPDWPYPSRLALGLKLSDATYRNAPYFRFEVNGKMYQIERRKAIILGRKHKLSQGTLPNLIPKEEFEEVREKTKEEKLEEMARAGTFG